MAQWASASISDVKAAYDESSNAIDRFEALQKSPDVNAAKAECEDMTQPIDIKLAATLPTPDPDLTNALQAIIDDARNVATQLRKSPQRPSADEREHFRRVC